MHTTKIATCCYCGSRTVLELTARGGHELACASCGAPVHEMKSLRKKDKSSEGKKRPSQGYGDAKSRKKQKKRKGGGFWQMLEEVADVVEDIID